MRTKDRDNGWKAVNHYEDINALSLCMSCASRLMNVQLLFLTSLVFVGFYSTQFCCPSYARFIIAMTLQDGQWSDKTITKQIISPSPRVSSCLVHWWTALYPWPSLHMVFVMDKLSSTKVKQKKKENPLRFLITSLYLILSLPVWHWCPQLVLLPVLLPGPLRRTSTLHFCLTHKQKQQWETYPRPEGPG